MTDYRNPGKHPRVNLISSRMKNTAYFLKHQGLGTREKVSLCQITIIKIFGVNLPQVNIPFLYPLKTRKTEFSCFHGVQKGNIGLKWAQQQIIDHTSLITLCSTILN